MSGKPPSLGPSSFRSTAFVSAPTLATLAACIAPRSIVLANRVAGTASSNLLAAIAASSAAFAALTSYFWASSWSPVRSFSARAALASLLAAANWRSRSSSAAACPTSSPVLGNVATPSGLTGIGLDPPTIEDGPSRRGTRPGSPASACAAGGPLRRKGSGLLACTAGTGARTTLVAPPI